MATDTSPSFHDGCFFKDIPVLKNNSVWSSSSSNDHSINWDDVPLWLTDPRINDAPRLESKSEWYYFQSHLTSTISEDPHHTVIVCIFRHSPDDSAADHSWAVIYATLDWRTQKYTTYAKVPPGVPTYAAKVIEGSHSLLSTTIQDMVDSCPNCEDGAPFTPDMLFTNPVQIRQSAEGEGPAIQLDWDNGAFLVGENGSYHLKIPEIELDIQVHATGPMMLHGNDGVTLKGDKYAMFYYSWPRTEAAGEYRGARVVGTAWVDHEYALDRQGNYQNPDTPLPGWMWFSLLTVGAKPMEICIAKVFQHDEVADQYIVYLDESGQHRREYGFSLTSCNPWVSGQTFQRFDTHWRLTVPSRNVDIEIEAVTQNQEFQTWIRLPSFYEGAIRFSGTWEGLPIKGFGAMELVNEIKAPDKYMDLMLNNASSLVRAEIETAVPPLVRPNHFEHVTKVRFDSFEEKVIQESIVDAFYMLSNRGGKNWRPMLLGAAIGLVGGNANDWRPFLAIPEMIHTASLIIDDIEDDSETRRGGPCVHKVVGVPSAINAGCAIYFWGETIIRDSEALSEVQRRDYYVTYFEMMRSAHAGQALDIAGMAMEKLPTIEEAKAMLSRIVNLHRCKSGKPASCCGIAGSRLGGGRPEQTDAIGVYVQNLGIAFQIRDDVLDVLGNIKGKNVADDLKNHKITYPVAKLFTLDHPDREKWFGYWEDRNVPALVDVLKSSGTMDMCNKEIERMVLEGWDLVDSLTPNSFSKVLFRMFGNFLIEQHY
ncbi:Terpenoid synthase [Metarhizium guizhouense ARSEF 977]|uniref:Terpenoid synthase n=1 Tax=Metarhizium guizhouense (strain ARSEF 977) TaxID=1276136 RepID=A0A0B4GNH2_METGA|nr:Terpenoid synthase [Metarhizium guizhouense ARSEF 977]